MDTALNVSNFMLVNFEFRYPKFRWIQMENGSQVIEDSSANLLVLMEKITCKEAPTTCSSAMSIMFRNLDIHKEKIALMEEIKVDPHFKDYYIGIVSHYFLMCYELRQFSFMLTMGIYTGELY
ncbi:hypothetical protein ACJX0J_009334, partial [Zea mays]